MAICNHRSGTEGSIRAVGTDLDRGSCIDRRGARVGVVAKECEGAGSLLGDTGCPGAGDNAGVGSRGVGPHGEDAVGAE